MAEFKKVIEEWRRMCGSFDENCNKCPLLKYCNPETKAFEDIVMTWSKENPPEIYPTLNDVLTSIINFYSTKLNTNNIQLFFDLYKDKQIPKELAEKFGILPINMCGLNKYVEDSEWR